MGGGAKLARRKRARRGGVPGKRQHSAAPVAAGAAVGLVQADTAAPWPGIPPPPRYQVAAASMQAASAVASAAKATVKAAKQMPTLAEMEKKAPADKAEASVSAGRARRSLAVARVRGVLTGAVSSVAVVCVRARACVWAERCGRGAVAAGLSQRGGTAGHARVCARTLSLSLCLSLCLSVSLSLCLCLCLSRARSPISLCADGRRRGQDGCGSADVHDQFRQERKVLVREVSSTPRDCPGDMVPAPQALAHVIVCVCAHVCMCVHVCACCVHAHVSCVSSRVSCVRVCVRACVFGCVCCG